MRVVVTGGRTLTNVAMIKNGLESFIREIGEITELLHGDAEGADRTAAWVAVHLLKIPVITEPANWSDVTAQGAVIKYRRGGYAYNALAGHWRNQRMIDLYKPEYGIVFPGGKGTADMKQRLIVNGVKIYEV